MAKKGGKTVEVEEPEEEQDVILFAKLKSRDKELAKEIAKLATNYRELSQSSTAAENAKKAYMKLIKPTFDKVKEKKLIGDGWTLVRVTGGGVASISAEKLLALGVTMDKIKKATVYSDEYTYYQVIRGKSEDEQ